MRLHRFLRLHVRRRFRARYWLGKAYRPLTATEDGGRSAPGHFALVGPTDEWIGAEE